MTAREAYNVVKAAEDGQAGNPEDCRDWRIPPPLNTLLQRQQSPSSQAPPGGNPNGHDRNAHTIP